MHGNLMISKCRWIREQYKFFYKLEFLQYWVILEFRILLEIIVFFLGGISYIGFLRC